VGARGVAGVGTASPRRVFAAYWRLSYPGSAIIRRVWLDGIAARALRDGEPARGADAGGAAQRGGGFAAPSAPSAVR